MKLLIVKMSSLGDVIHTLPLAKILKDRFGENITIDWVINSEYKSLIENNGIVRRAIPFRRREWLSLSGFIKSFREVRAFAKELKSEQYDVVLDVQGLLKSALVVAMAGGKHTVGFSDAREGATFFYNTKIAVDGVMHAVDKNLLFLNFFNISWQKDDIAFPVTISDNDRRYVDQILAQLQLKKPFAVFCPFSRWQTKMWGEEKFHRLEEMLEKLDIPVIWTGSKNEKLKTSAKYDLTGKLSLNQLFYLMTMSYFVVTCDSGAMHLASAAGADIISLFGPTSPVKTGAYGIKNRVIVMQRNDLSCVPCFGKNCNIGNVCMDISPEKVFGKIRELIAR